MSEEKVISFNLKEKDITAIEQIIDATVAHFIDRLPQTLNKQLETLVFALLGFRVDAWGKTELIDRPTIGVGRSQSLIELIEAKAHDVCTDAVSKCNITIGEKHEQAILALYAEKVQAHFQYEITSLVQKHIDTYFNKISASGELKLNVMSLTPTPKDLTDPKHMENMPKLRDLIYKELLNKDPVPPSSGGPTAASSCEGFKCVNVT